MIIVVLLAIAVVIVIITLLNIKLFHKELQSAPAPHHGSPHSAFGSRPAKAAGVFEAAKSRQCPYKAHRPLSYADYRKHSPCAGAVTKEAQYKHQNIIIVIVGAPKEGP